MVGMTFLWSRKGLVESFALAIIATKSVEITVDLEDIVDELRLFYGISMESIDVLRDEDDSGKSSIEVSTTFVHALHEFVYLCVGNVGFLAIHLSDEG